MEKELMRHFDWKVPIGLRMDWVSLPYDNRTKWSDQAPGIMLPHLFVRAKHAHLVDAGMQKWFHPATPKKDLPFAAQCHYISDWKAAQRGILSVRAYNFPNTLFTHIGVPISKDTASTLFYGVST
eukprot:12627529-Ditylum_brightwellii.AAC.1